MTKIVKLTENDLVDIIKKVISEQTPDRKRFITKSQTKLTQGERTQGQSSYSKQYEAFKSEGQATEDNTKFNDLRIKVNSLVNFQERDNGYVKNILVGQSQIDLWEKIKIDDMYYAADIINAVISKSGSDAYKYCRLGTNKTAFELTDPSMTTPPEDDETPGEVDVVTIPSEIVQQDFFDNNSSALKQPGIDEFMATFIEPYKTALAKIRQTYPNAGICIQRMYIESSASRFRNQGGAKDMSFLQLSEARAKTVEYLLMNAYGKLGGNWCTGTRTTTINAKGQNGDGTSGPNPPVGYTFLPKGVDYNFDNFVDTRNMAPKDKATYEGKRNQFGTPEPADKGGAKAYEKYRYVRPTVDVELYYGDEKPNVPDTLEGEKIAPDKIESKGQKYWAVLYRWKFSIITGRRKFDRKKKKNHKNKEYQRVNKHHSVQEDPSKKCLKKSADKIKREMKKDKRRGRNYSDRYFSK
jgi:hypothetical protein